MKYHVSCLDDDPYYYFDQILEDCEVYSTIGDYFSNECSCYTDYEYHIGPIFQIDASQIEKNMLEYARHYLDDDPSNSKVFVFETLEENHLEKYEILLSNLCFKVIESTVGTDCGFEPGKKQIIFDALSEFLDKGEWHAAFCAIDGTLCKDYRNVTGTNGEWALFGETVYPILWFGEEYVSESPWNLTRDGKRWKVLNEFGEFSAELLDLDEFDMEYSIFEYGLDIPRVDDYYDRWNLGFWLSEYSEENFDKAFNEMIILSDSVHP